MWPAGNYLIATAAGPRTVTGFAYRGIGLHQIFKAKQPAKDRWILTHLGSGHSLCQITGDLQLLLPACTALAEAGDWTFDGLDGYRNQFPDAAAHMRTFRERLGATGLGTPSHPEQARTIAQARA